MTDQLRTQVVCESQIGPSLDAAICRLQFRAFPHKEQFHHSRHYKHIPRPDDRRVLAWRGEELVSQVVMVRAILTAGGEDSPVIGLGNVCSDPDARGIGAASACLREAMELARTDRAEWAILFCRAELADFYGRFGFEPFDNEVTLTHPDGSTFQRDWHDQRYVARLTGRALPEGPLKLDIEDF